LVEVGGALLAGTSGLGVARMRGELSGGWMRGGGVGAGGGWVACGGWGGGRRERVDPVWTAGEHAARERAGWGVSGVGGGSGGGWRGGLRAGYGLAVGLACSGFRNGRAALRGGAGRECASCWVLSAGVARGWLGGGGGGGRGRRAGGRGAGWPGLGLGGDGDGLRTGLGVGWVRGSVGGG